jgi:hypothetical protein
MTNDTEKPTLATAAPLLSTSVYLRSHSAVSGKDVQVAMMTSGGLAPCLSASIAMLTKFWIKAYRDGEITGLTLRMYKDGYKGVLTGDSFVIPESDWDRLVHLADLGGSPIGNSRVKVRRDSPGEISSNDWWDEEQRPLPHNDDHDDECRDSLSKKTTTTYTFSLSLPFFG